MGWGGLEVTMRIWASLARGARERLQVLTDARVVALHPEGRDVLVSLEPESLDQAKTFIAELERLWDARLDALQRLLEKERPY